MAIFELGKQFPLTDPRNALMDSGLDSTQRALIGHELFPRGSSMWEYTATPEASRPFLLPYLPNVREYSWKKIIVGEGRM